MQILESTRLQLQKQKSLRESLPKENYIVSLHDDTAVPAQVGGRVMTADNEVAARVIAEKTHVLASPEQIETYKAHQAKQKAAIEKAFDATKHKTEVVFPDHLINQIKEVAVHAAEVTTKAKK